MAGSTFKFAKEVFHRWKSNILTVKEWINIEKNINIYRCTVVLSEEFQSSQTEKYWPVQTYYQTCIDEQTKQGRYC